MSFLTSIAVYYQAPAMDIFILKLILQTQSHYSLGISRKREKAERAVARKTTKLQLGRLFPDDQTSMHLIPSISLTRHAASRITQASALKK